MEALPDLASLSDAELKELIKQLESEENEISFQRRLLHGKLDILRAELVARLQQKGEDDDAGQREQGNEALAQQQQGRSAESVSARSGSGSARAGRLLPGGLRR